MTVPNYFSIYLSFNHFRPNFRRVREAIGIQMTYINTEHPDFEWDCKMLNPDPKHPAAGPNQSSGSSYDKDENNCELIRAFPPESQSMERSPNTIIRDSSTFFINRPKQKSDSVKKGT